MKNVTVYIRKPESCNMVCGGTDLTIKCQLPIYHNGAHSATPKPKRWEK